MGNAVYRKDDVGNKIRVRNMKHKTNPMMLLKSDTFSGSYWGAMVIKADGTLWATGSSNYGQFGFGDNLQRNIFTQIGTETDWKYVSCGFNFSMAIKENGTLWATGDNTYGQLGLGDNISKNTFTQVGTETNWASVFCGGQHAIAIKKDNSVWGVGRNGQGQLGLGDIINRNSFVKIESLSDIKSVDCGSNFTMVTTVENELYGTGSNNYGQLGIVGSSFLTDFTKVGSYYFWENIACGNTWAMGSLATGLSYVAGDNEYGTLGLGDTTDRPIFVPLSGWEWKNIRPTFGSHVLAITLSGHLHSWGRNHHGQSGRGYANILSIITEPLTPIDDRTDWKRCGKTGQFSMVIDTSNQLWVCGDNTSGQLGLGDTTDRWTFTDTGVVVKDIADDETSVSSGVRAKGVYYKTGTGTNTFSSSIKTYGVRIDNTNPNPETGVEYTDDAVGMTGGSTTWDTLFPFLDIKPCLLKEGVVQYYLNPNNYSQKADGSASDITSGTDGDVMIEIPKMAYSMKTVGNYLYVKVTNNPSPTNNVDGTEDWCFHAHTREEGGDCAKLYVGAYLGWTDGSSKLRSLSGKAPTTTQTIGTFRTRAQANGTGYDQMAFYPLTLLQCLFLIRYKNRDSQTALGRGFVDGNATPTNTGGTNTRGMYYGETTGKVQMKFAGIEDFWGNLFYWIDGLFSNTTRNILTAFKAFNDTGSGYTDRGQGAVSNIVSYMSVCQGTSATGFIAKTGSGSDSTYFCDYTYLYSSRLPVFGGYRTSASAAGAFRLYLNYSAAGAFSILGGRLMYLGVSAPEPVKIRVNL